MSYDLCRIEIWGKKSLKTLFTGTEKKLIPFFFRDSHFCDFFSVTIAIGTSLLILNILIFAAVYYQRDRNKMGSRYGQRLVLLRRMLKEEVCSVLCI